MSSSAFQTHIVESFCDECLRSPNSVTAMAVGSPGCERDNQAPEACGSKDVLRGDRVLRPNLVPLGEGSSFAPKSVEPGTNKVCFCGCYRTRSYVLCLFHTLPSKLQSSGRNRLVLNVKLEPSLALICKWLWTRRDSMPRTCKP